MDKITRILLLYSKLIKGESINKISFCMETDSNERTFDRDIEDIRLFLSESFCAEELLYDRTKKNYHLSGVVRKDFQMTEYRFLERLLEYCGLLRIDELEGLLSILASNAVDSRACLERITKIDGKFIKTDKQPLLKKHEDLSLMIDSKAEIEILYQDVDLQEQSYVIIPLDILIVGSQMKLEAIYEVNNSRDIIFFELEKIESFKEIRRISSKELYEIKEYTERGLKWKEKE